MEKAERISEGHRESLTITDSRKRLFRRGVNDEQELSACGQFLLVIAFVGVEMSVAFQFLYTILFLELIGVPTALLPSGEILSGTIALLMFPGIAWYSGKSTNPLKQKTKMLICSSSAFVIGYLAVISCAAWKMLVHPSGTVASNVTYNYTNRHGTTPETMTYLNIKSNESDVTPFPSSIYNNRLHANMTEVSSSIDSQDYTVSKSTVSVAVCVVGILGFSLLDMGYDTAMATGRLFVMECSPPKMHGKILNTIAITQSLGGFAFSILGTVDFPEFLGNVLGVDGTAATVLLCGCVVLCVVLATFIGTLVTGLSLASRRRNRDEDYYRDVIGDGVHATWEDTKRGGYVFRNGKEEIYNDDSVSHFKDSSSEKRVLLDGDTLGSKGSYSTFTSYHDPEGFDDKPHCSFQNTVGDGMNTTEKEVLFVQEEDNNCTSVLSMSGSWAGRGFVDSAVWDGEFERRERLAYSNKRKSSGNRKLYSSCCLNWLRNIIKALSVPFAKSHTKGIYDYDEHVAANGVRNKDCGTSGSLNGNEKMSGRVRKGNKISDSAADNNGQIFENVYSENNEEIIETGKRSELQQQKSRVNDLSIWRMKRLMVMSLSVFFTTGTSILWNIYNGNALTVGIYGGNPAAPYGSEGRQLYNMGVRRTSLGNALFFLTNVLCSVFSKKAISVIGPRGQYVIYHVIFIASLVAFSTFKSEELYFLSAIAAGIFRPCIFGLSYMMSTEYVTEECTKNGLTEDKKNKLLSQSIALMGTLMPCQYLITASLMGPLMSVTGDVWVPIVSAVVWTSLSLAIFLGLFCTKR